MVKGKPQGSRSLLTPRSDHATVNRVLFARLLILDLAHHQNVITSSLYYPGPFHKFSSNLFMTFGVMLSTNKQTRSTWRVQTCLATTDDYSHIAHCMK